MHIVEQETNCTTLRFPPSANQHTRTHTHTHTCIDTLIVLTHMSSTLQVTNTRVPGSFKARRAKDWTTLSTGELLVWIGITMKMGTLGSARVSHCWSSHDDFGNAAIKSCMSMTRYVAITANLSFAPRGTRPGWDKLAWLDKIIRAACRAATGITQHVTVDESMIKCLSKFCSWIQYMPKNPSSEVHSIIYPMHVYQIYIYTHIHSMHNRDQSILFSSFKFI